MLVEKKDGSIRFCVDYRKLNEITRKDVYPIPDLMGILESMKDNIVFTTLDLAAGYWQVEIEEKDKEKTAFVCDLSLFEFNACHLG